MHFYKLLYLFLISYIILIIIEIYKTFKIYIYTEMSDIVQDIKYLRVKLHISPGTDTW